MKDFDNVAAALEIVMEEIETRISLLDKNNSRAWYERDFKKAGELLKMAEDVTAFREEVHQLQKKWEKSFPHQQNDISEDAMSQKKGVQKNGKIRRGMRTREIEFRIPILGVLIDQGGGASMKTVLAQLENRMKGVLKSIDYEGLPSDPDTIRWKNTAQWSRQAMVDEGLLRNDSPRGIWEISDIGRDYYEGNSK